MCGIIAFANICESSAAASAIPDLKSALKLIHHRGPDGQGFWIADNKRAGLGHARLSIMDLDHGQQPMSDETGMIQAVVNGEFYEFEAIRQRLIDEGHQFKTHCDSEILVHLYKAHGLALFDYLIGEFAFCLWDAAKSLFICARDRFGIKPLFFTVQKGRLLVASEAKAFLKMGWDQPEWDIDSVVNSGVFLDYRTMFRGVSKVPPGQYLTLTSSGTMTLNRYFRPDYPDKSIPDSRSTEEMIQGVRSRLVQAVRTRLRSDVPVAVYLSGGIDSSSVLGVANAIIKETNPDATIDAFTIKFRECSGYDESEIAERTAAHCGANFKIMSAHEGDLADALEEAVWHWETPAQDMNGAAKFLLSKFVRENGYKVVLTGEGSDEHFAGYSFFQADALRSPNCTVFTDEERAAKLDEIENSDPAMWSALGLTQMSFKDHKVARNLLNGISTHRVLSLLFEMPKELFTDECLAVTGLPNGCMTSACAVDGVQAANARSKWHPLHSGLFIESQTFLPNVLCNHLGDRSEMAHSVEGRVPFLDHRLTEYVNNLPPSVKIKFPTDKWILRKAVEPFVTKELAERVKVPFLAPPARPDPNSKHCQLLKRRVTRNAVEKLGWARWDFVEKHFDSFLTMNNRQSQNILNTMFGIIVLSEKFNIKTWCPLRN